MFLRDETPKRLPVPSGLNLREINAKYLEKVY